MKVHLRGLIFALTPSLIITAQAYAASPSQPPPPPPKSNYTIVKPNDARVTYTIGALRIETWNPVTMTPLEENTRLYFTVTNTAKTPRTIEHENRNLDVDGIHVNLQRHFGTSGASSNASVTINPGESRSLEFTLERFLTGKTTQREVPITFRSVEDGVTDSIALDVTTYWFDGSLEQKSTAYISGRVTNSAGKPVAGARVVAGLFAMTNVRSATTDKQGKYRLGILSLADVKTILGDRPLPYGDFSYFLSIDAKGYANFDKTIGSPVKGKTVTVNAALKPVTMLNYKEIGSFASDGTLAYWWVEFAGDKVIATQGQHPPVTQTTGHVVAISLTGKEIWRQNTGGQCWGFDVSEDKALVAVGCDDGYVYVNRISDGTLLFKLHTGDRPTTGGPSPVKNVRFSPDSRLLAVDGTGGTGGFSVLNAITGQVVWTSKSYTSRPYEMWGYKLRWSPDGTRLIAADNGLIASFTSDGRMEWRQVIGYLPFNIEFDDKGNIYAGTKDHLLISYATDGKVRWMRTLSQTPEMSRKLMSTTGNIMVMPSFDGLLQAFDFNGKVLWQHVMPARSVPYGPQYWVPGAGHNAAMSTDDGSLFAVASRGYETVVYDRSGNVRWYHIAPARQDFKGEDPDSHGNMTGGQSLTITPDGNRIAVGYADSVIRIFERK